MSTWRVPGYTKNGFIHFAGEIMSSSRSSIRSKLRLITFSFACLLTVTSMNLGQIIKYNASVSVAPDQVTQSLSYAIVIPEQIKLQTTRGLRKEVRRLMREWEHPPLASNTLFMTSIRVEATWAFAILSTQNPETIELKDLQTVSEPENTVFVLAVRSGSTWYSVHDRSPELPSEIGRASCRERV